MEVPADIKENQDGGTKTAKGAGRKPAFKGAP